MGDGKLFYDSNTTENMLSEMAHPSLKSVGTEMPTVSVKEPEKNNVFTHIPNSGGETISSSGGVNVNRYHQSVYVPNIHESGQRNDGVSSPNPQSGSSEHYREQNSDDYGIDYVDSNTRMNSGAVRDDDFRTDSGISLTDTRLDDFYDSSADAFDDMTDSILSEEPVSNIRSTDGEIGKVISIDNTEIRLEKIFDRGVHIAGQAAISTANLRSIESGKTAYATGIVGYYGGKFIINQAKTVMLANIEVEDDPRIHELIKKLGLKGNDKKAINKELNNILRNNNIRALSGSGSQVYAKALRTQFNLHNLTKSGHIINEQVKDAVELKKLLGKQDMFKAKPLFSRFALNQALSIARRHLQSDETGKGFTLSATVSARTARVLKASRELMIKSSRMSLLATRRAALAAAKAYLEYLKRRQASIGVKYAKALRDGERDIETALYIKNKKLLNRQKMLKKEVKPPKAMTRMWGSLKNSRFGQAMSKIGNRFGKVGKAINNWWHDPLFLKRLFKFVMKKTGQGASKIPVVRVFIAAFNRLFSAIGLAFKTLKRKLIALAAGVAGMVLVVILIANTIAAIINVFDMSWLFDDPYNNTHRLKKHIEELFMQDLMVMTQEHGVTAVTFQSDGRSSDRYHEIYSSNEADNVIVYSNCAEIMTMAYVWYNYDLENNRNDIDEMFKYIDQLWYGSHRIEIYGSTATYYTTYFDGLFDVSIREDRDRTPVNVINASRIMTRFGELIWPLNCYQTLYSPFGKRNGSDDFHNGLDIAVSDGNSVYAASNAMVAYAGNSGSSAGNVVCLYLGNGKDANGNEVPIFARYYHLSQVLVHEGETVNAGQVVALTGHSGGNYGPHLHFCISVGEPGSPTTGSPWLGKQYNPLAFYDYTNASVVSGDGVVHKDISSFPINGNWQNYIKYLKTNTNSGSSGTFDLWEDNFNITLTADTIPASGDWFELACCLYAEAHEDNYESCMAVGTIIMNRVDANISYYGGNTIHGVLYQPYQFAPTLGENNKYNEAMRRGLELIYQHPELVRAVLDLMNGVRDPRLEGYYCYRTDMNGYRMGRDGIPIGGNWFFKE